MSIKIYNGFKCSLTNISDLNKEINDFRSKLNNLIKENIVKYIAKEAVRIFDAVTLGNLNLDFPEGKSSVQLAVDDFKARQNKIKMSGHRDPEIDFSCELAVLSEDNVALGMIFTEQQFIADLWYSFPSIVEYGYWDNSDRPDDVSKEEWEERESSWTKLLAPNWRPSDKGASYLCSDIISGNLDLSEIMNNLPAFDKRLHRLAVEQVYNRLVREAEIKPEKPGDYANLISQSMQITTSDKEEDKKIWQQEQYKVASKLKKDIHLEDLDRVLKVKKPKNKNP